MKKLNNVIYIKEKNGFYLYLHSVKSLKKKRHKNEENMSQNKPQGQQSPA